MTVRNQRPGDGKLNTISFRLSDFQHYFIWLIVYEIGVWEALEAFVGSATGMRCCPE